MRKAHRFAEGPIVFGGDAAVRMQRIAVARERRDFHSARGELAEEHVDFAGAPEQAIDIAMIGACVTAGANFDGLHTEAGEIIQRLLEFDRPENDCEDTNFHTRRRKLNDQRQFQIKIVIENPATSELEPRTEGRLSRR
jgi:hypothetical protein